MYGLERYFYILLSSQIILFSGAEVQTDPKKKDIKDEILPPCQACKVLTNSFQNGMLKTNKNHFGGGDTAWEEEKLGEYAESETRLVEIQEQLCSDVGKSQNQCYKLAEEWEGHIEEWWFKHKKEEPDLHKWLCVSKVEYCCPDLHFGPECKPCSGYPDNVCYNNGKCKGSGTRKGNGECVCNSGYTGVTCNACAPAYYESYKDEHKMLCSKCHPSCKGSCKSAGPKGCFECVPGWVLHKENGCVDIDECISKSPCKKNEFCVNNEGSYSCLACDPSCAECYGDGPDMCGKCASGYILRDGFCQIDKSWKEKSADWTRYLTYLGLCIATCIIFQKNTLIASIIGVAVAVYVSVSEYLLHNVLNSNQESVVLK